MSSTTTLEASLLNSLRASEERYRTLLESSSDWIWEIDKNTVYTYCSPQCLDMLGYQPEEMLGKTPLDLMPAEEALRIGKILQNIMDEKHSFSHLENINLHKEGHQLILETSGVPFFDKQGDLLGFRGIDRDITSRKAAEAGLRRQAQVIDQIHDSVIVTDMQGIVNSWNTGAERLFGINKPDAIGRHINFIYPEEEHAFLQNQLMIPLLATGFHEARVRMLSSNCVIFHAHVSLSLLYDEQHKPEGIIGYFIDISSQVKAGQALRISEKNLETTLNSIGEAVIVTDTEQRITRMNPVAEQLTEWPLVEALGQPVSHIFKLCDSQTGEKIACPVSKVVSDKKIIQLAHGSILITRSGSQLHIADSAAPILDETNHFMGVVLVFNDVTRQYQTLQALYQSNLQFSAFVSAMPDIVFILDEQGQYLNIYGTKQHLLYQQASSVLHKYVTDILPPPQAEQILNTIQATLDSNKTQLVEYELVLAPGKRYFEGRVAPMLNRTDGSRQVLWVARDITEKKRALQALQASEQRFREIFDKVPNIAVQGYNCHREVTYWNQASENIYGYTQQEVIGQKLEDLIIPADVKEQVITATDSFFYQDLHIPAGELLLQRKDGSSITVFSSHIKLGKAPEQAEMFCIDIDLTEAKKASEAIQQLAFFDSLTHLPNRRLFLDRLSQEQKISKRHSSYMALLFLDIDHFKTLNDSLGHSVGDLLLVEVGRRMQNAVREEDTVARLGGDEFVVLLTELSSDQFVAAKQVHHIAEKIMAEFALPINIHRYEHIVTASIGITLFRGAEDSADTLLKQADTAMYRAKKAGRNTFHFFHPSMQVAADVRLALEKDLHQALRHHELELYYQPQFDNYGNITGAEALLRWQHPTRGMVLPSEFIAVAEEAGLIIAMGEWIISTACKQLQQWEKQGLPTGFHLAINVSPKQFRVQTFVPHLQREINQCAIKPEHLTLELTEGIVIDNIQQTIIKMKALKSTGVKFSIDDFGTGYSSLVYLKQLPLNQLKIDQAFIRDIETAPNDAIIVEAIITMAKLLGLSVIAEGVETLKQLAFLQSQGCQNYQGYYFCKPLPEKEFSAKLKMAVKSTVILKGLSAIPPEAGHI
ncbi:MAG: PAS domain S-box protein [Methyloprofundus sp.]|nr:PAS domain S-box protein [Methyloprofundus sp.]